ncbi:hypothetical protein BAE44_0013071, partial [Dichanthelium oligosanthes]
LTPKNTTRYGTARARPHFCSNLQHGKHGGLPCCNPLHSRCACLSAAPPVPHQEAASTVRRRWTPAASVTAQPAAPRPPPSAGKPDVPQAPVARRVARPGHAPAPRHRAHGRGLLDGRRGGGHEDPRARLLEPAQAAHGRAPPLRLRRGLLALRPLLLPRRILSFRGVRAGGRCDGRPRTHQGAWPRGGWRRQPERRPYLLLQGRHLARRVRRRELRARRRR